MSMRAQEARPLPPSPGAGPARLVGPTAGRRQARVKWPPGLLARVIELPTRRRPNRH